MLSEQTWQKSGRKYSIILGDVSELVDLLEFITVGWSLSNKIVSKWDTIIARNFKIKTSIEILSMLL